MKIGSYGFTLDRHRGKTEWIIYYNPLCSKSREALDLLRANGIDPKIVEYLQTPLKKTEIEDLLALLKIEPKELIRVKEKAFVENPIDLTNKDAVVESITQNPALLERPIIVHGNKAVIGRPPERVLELLE